MCSPLQSQVMSSADAVRVCVTGATGFFASELVAQLLGHGYHVRATVRSFANTERNMVLGRVQNSGKTQCAGVNNAERIKIHGTV